MEGNSDKEPPLLQIDPKWYVSRATVQGHQSLNGTSIKDALRAFLPPIKSDDGRLDFYTVYKKEATEYDVDYVKKYDEDLNTTLIFVRCALFALATRLTHPRRLVCSLLSARRSLSTSNRSWRPTRTSNPQRSSAPSSSLSTSPPSLVRTPPPHLSRKILPTTSSQPPDSCMQVS